MLSKRSLLCVGLLVPFLLTGCQQPEPPAVTVADQKDYRRQLPPGEKALVKLTDPADWPDFSPGFQHKGGLEQ